MFSQVIPNKYGSITVKSPSIEQGLELSSLVLDLKSQLDKDRLKTLVDVYKRMDELVTSVDMEYQGQSIDTWEIVLSNFAFMPIAQHVLESMIRVADSEADESEKK